MTIKTKAEIVTNLVIDEKTLASLEKVQGNVYIVNQNTGSIYVQTNLVDCLANQFKKHKGLNEVMDQLRNLYINFALTECKTVTAAAKRLKLTERTLFYYIKEKKALALQQRPDLEIDKSNIVKNDNLLE